MPTVIVSKSIDVGQLEVRLRSSDALVRRLMIGGIRVQTAARDRLGRSPKRIDTGRLRSSIGVAAFQKDGAAAVSVGTNVEYAIYVHEGTRYMEANPFLADALREVFG